MKILFQIENFFDFLADKLACRDFFIFSYLLAIIGMRSVPDISFWQTAFGGLLLAVPLFFFLGSVLFLIWFAVEVLILLTSLGGVLRGILAASRNGGRSKKRLATPAPLPPAPHR